MPDWLPERLPEDPEAERSFLATCCAAGMEDRASIVTADLRPEDFMVPKHQVLFDALTRLLAQRQEVNALTLKDCIYRMGKLDMVEGFGGLVDLLGAEEVGRPEVLASIIKRKARFRKLLKIGAKLVRYAGDEHESPEFLADNAGKVLLQLVQGDSTRGLAHVSRASAAAIQRIHDTKEGGVEYGVKVGFPLFDLLTHGLQAGELIVLAARPGVGKSTLAQNWALHAVNRDHGVAFFSLEMSEVELFNRLLSSYAPMHLERIKGARELQDIDLADIYRARDEMERMPLFISDQAEITVAQIKAQIIQQGIAGRPVKMAIIDYLQLMSSPKDSRGAKQNEAVRIGEISRGLKLMAKDLNIPVVVLSQLNREVEHRQGGKPQLSDLRDSGAIEQDADMVVFIHRRMIAEAETGEPTNDAELIIAKHRNGKTKVINMTFKGEICRYIEQERSTSATAGINGPPKQQSMWDQLKS